MSALKDSLYSLREELRTSTRLRLGSYVVMLILLINGLLIQSDRIGFAKQDYERSSARLYKMHRLKSEEQISALLDLEQQANTELKEHLWHGKTPGEVQARLGKHLSDLLKPLSLQNPRIRIGELSPVKGVPSIWSLQADVSGQYKKGTVPYLLQGLDSEQESLVVRRLSLRDRNRRLTMIVTAYVVGLQMEGELGGAVK